ncbi:hypothetical protein ABZ605_27770 [Streptomyces sp. NPDC012765]|uniref:hypothetical protein n=1 Tax=Streptomyces sp. NPDC012765 TaxID=3155249 RepID=UPI0033FBE452
MTTTTAAPPVILAPSSDPGPVQQAVVESLLAGAEPETFLWIEFHLPDGGVRLRYAWTAGGAPLGDRIDRIAMAAEYDAADWLTITATHRTDSTRGRIVVQTHRLRPILADVQAGVRGTAAKRDELGRVLRAAARHSGRPLQGPPVLPRWLGVGPLLLNRPH